MQEGQANKLQSCGGQNTLQNNPHSRRISHVLSRNSSELLPSQQGDKYLTDLSSHLYQTNKRPCPLYSQSTKALEVPLGISTERLN